MSCKVVTFSFSMSGASLASALAILSVKLSLRRLPTIVTMLYGAAIGGDPLLKRNRLPCTSRTCQKMQVHEIGFQEAMTESSIGGGCPQGSGCEYATSEFPDSLVGQPHRAVEAKLTLAPGAQSNASALTICQPGFKNATNFWFRTPDGNGVSRCTTRITSSMPSRFPSLS